MSYAIRNFGLLVAVSLLSSCGGTIADQRAEAASATPATADMNDEIVRIGEPYTIGTTTYTPVDAAQYDEVGYASQYGSDFDKRLTANGEQFGTPGAAHRTLPMPSYVEVTALDSGRTILVRINDRGPLSNDRLIELSEGAAQQLGIAPQSVAGVRVRRVNPPEQEKAVLRQGMTAAERIETPEPLLKVLREKLAKLPLPVPTEQQRVAVAEKPSRIDKPSLTNDDRFIREGGNVPKSEAPSARSEPSIAGNYFAQIAAFTSRSRADALAVKSGASVIASADRLVFRVRFGPFVTQAEAVTEARKKGYPQARVYRD